MADLNSVDTTFSRNRHATRNNVRVILRHTSVPNRQMRQLHRVVKFRSYLFVLGTLLEHAVHLCTSSVRFSQKQPDAFSADND